MTNGQPDDLDDWYAAEAAADRHGAGARQAHGSLAWALGLIPLGLAAYLATHRRKAH